MTINEDGVLAHQGSEYPYHPTTGEPWTEETAAAFIASLVPPVQEEPAPVARTLRIDKVRFKQELLTNDEQVLFNKTKRQIDRLTDEDYDDPTKQLLVGAEVLLEYLTDAEAIELDHPKTIFGVGTLLVALGIVTPERAAVVLQNKTQEEADAETDGLDDDL